MKETPLSNCERRFLLRAIQERKVRCRILLLVPCPFPPQLQGSAAPRCGRIRPGVVQCPPRVCVCVSPQRLDGRQCYDYRNVRISFGPEHGCCVVELGKTRWERPAVGRSARCSLREWGIHGCLGGPYQRLTAL